MRHTGNPWQQTRLTSSMTPLLCGNISLSWPEPTSGPALRPGGDFPTDGGCRALIAITAAGFRGSIRQNCARGAWSNATALYVGMQRALSGFRPDAPARPKVVLVCLRAPWDAGVYQCLTLPECRINKWATPSDLYLERRQDPHPS